MSFKKIKKFLKNYNVLVRPQGGPKFQKIEIFMKIACFLLLLFCHHLVAYPVIYYRKELLKLRRMVYNLPNSVHI